MTFLPIKLNTICVSMGLHIYSSFDSVDYKNPRAISRTGHRLLSHFYSGKAKRKARGLRVQKEVSMLEA